MIEYANSNRSVNSLMEDFEFWLQVPKVLYYLYNIHIYIYIYIYMIKDIDAYNIKSTLTK